MRLLLSLAFPLAAAVIPVDTAGLRNGPIRATATADALSVNWSDERGRPWTATFSLDTAKPVVTSIAQGQQVVLGGARPFYWAETGKRRGGWDQFFDFPPSHAEGTRRFQSEFTPTRAVVQSRGNRVEVRFEGLRLGIFSGAIAYTFFPGLRLIQQEAVVSTTEPDTAFFYDAGFQWTAEADRRPGGNMQSRLVWYDTQGRLRNEITPAVSQSERIPMAVRYRALAAQTAGGSIVAFPAPHQYFMPRDYTTNMSFLWSRSWRGQVGIGIRQLPDDHSPFYPWMNAPPGSTQRLSLFLQVDSGPPVDTLEEVLRYTNRDRFPRLAGYQRLASHWHFAYTVAAMEYGERWVPPFKTVLKDMGVDAAMIADFHGDGHPRDMGKLRIEELEAYYKFTRSQTDAQFLIIPGEEANIHFGGHYMVAFPKPVWWHMGRKAEEPFHDGRVYRTADAKELLDLVRRENGLVYTAHPRTKGSMGFPDKYRETEFFRDPHFVGTGWKQMPSNLSTPRLGLRALDLLDDMRNWGLAKQLIPEVDVFQIDATHDLYPHMNAAYVKLDALPGYDDYGKVLDCLRSGAYFASTGEVLLPEVSIRRGLQVEARVKWAMPLAEAWVIWGDGKQTRKAPIALDRTGAFGERQFTWRVEARGAKWARIEVWDVAGSGAFSTPVELQ